MSAKSHQLQWSSAEANPPEFRFHSKVEPDVGREQIAYYRLKANPIFVYRLVANDSKDALSPVAESVYAGRMETLPPVFPSGRSAA